MSEQTPTSTDDVSGVEPSMEDILASIRKIISEDEPVALESPEDIPPVELVGSAAASPVDDVLTSFGSSVSDAPNDTDLGVDIGLGESDGESVDLNIDDVLASLADEELEAPDSFVAEELGIPDIPDDATENFSVETLTEELGATEPIIEAVPDAVVETETVFETDDDILDFINANTEAEVTTDVEDLLEVVDGESPDSSLETFVSDDSVEMDALLDDILLAPDDAADDTPDETSAYNVDADDSFADDVLDDILDEPDLSSDAEQSDLELVKSLMAELSDNPSDLDLDNEIDALIDVDETTDVSLDDVISSESLEPEAFSSSLSADGESEDILGDILDMTLEDQLEAQSEGFDLGDLASLDEVAAAEQENILENVLEDAGPAAAETAEEVIIDETATELPSLAEIAAAAEADAVAVETSGLSAAAASGIGGAAAGAGLAALAAKVTDTPVIENSAETEADDIAADESETPETIDLETPTETESIPTQETSMPVKAVKTDTIIDEVTETAAIGAFAELNQVVEDKAVFNERGPRIGDLVQEALRPMLKEWLDANLKGIVERAVTKEVKRISKGQ